MYKTLQSGRHYFTLLNDVCCWRQVHGYPTIKMFPAGKKDAGDAVEYDGGRTSDAIVAWALEKVAENVPPPDVFEV